MKFYRTTVIPTDPFGLDSIQGLLEEALTYNNGEHWSVSFDPCDLTKPNSILFNLKELEKSGYVNLVLEDMNQDGIGPNLRMTHLSLTIEGRKLLEELRERSRWGRFRRRIVDLIWILVTSSATTLAVLWLKGEA